MKKTATLFAATSLLVSIGFGLSSCRQGPRIETTTNQNPTGHFQFLQYRISSLQPKDGQVQITGRHFPWKEGQPQTLPVGHRIEFPDDHGHTIYTIARIEKDGAVFKYESRFDHRSFGKDLITQDSGSFKLPWVTQAALMAELLVLEVHDRHEGARVDVRIDGDTLHITAISPGGIGGTRIELKSGVWPKKVIVHLWYSTGVPFTKLEGASASMEQPASPDMSPPAISAGKFADGRLELTPISATSMKVLYISWVDFLRH